MAGFDGFGRTKRLVLLAGALCIGGQAAAAMPGLYFSGFYMDSTLAYSTVDAKLAGFDARMQDAWIAAGGVAESWTSRIKDKNDIGYGFGVGYQLNEYLAAELGYLDIGSVRYESSGVVSDDFGSYNSETFMSAKTRGLALSGIGIWPMGDRWSFDAKAGVYFSRAKSRTALYVEGVYLGTLSDTDTKTSVLLSGGVNFSMSPGTAIRAGYTHLGKAMVGSADISSWTLSLKYAW